MNISVVQNLFLKSLFPKRIFSSNNVRRYGRWMHRNPAKIILPFEGSSLKKEKLIELDSEVFKKSKDRHADNLKQVSDSDSEIVNSNKNRKDVKNNTISPEQSKEIKNKRERNLLQQKTNIKEQRVFDENNEVIYEKVKNSDGRISSLFIKLKSKKDRAKCGQVLVEGWRLIVDGIQANCSLLYVIFSHTPDLNKIKEFLPKTGVKFYKIQYKEIEMWSNVETPPGIFGVFETPSIEKIKRHSKPLPIKIICDNIRVPDNLGAILRAAVGVGCEDVYLMKGCVDHWNPKVVRSASGAHFRLPIHSSVEWENLSNLVENSSVFIADNNTDSIGSNENDNNNEIELEMSKNSLGIDLPIVPYYSVEYGSLKSIVLVIGGETEGISEDCYRFAANRNGLRLNIPLQKGVDSLNSGMAAAVIAFEIKKQMIQAKAKHYIFYYYSLSFH